MDCGANVKFYVRLYPHEVRIFTYSIKGFLPFRLEEFCQWFPLNWPGSKLVSHTFSTRINFILNWHLCYMQNFLIENMTFHHLIMAMNAENTMSPITKIAINFAMNSVNLSECIHLLNRLIPMWNFFDDSVPMGLIIPPKLKKCFIGWTVDLTDLNNLFLINRTKKLKHYSKNMQSWHLEKS